MNIHKTAYNIRYHISTIYNNYATLRRIKCTWTLVCAAMYIPLIEPAAAEDKSTNNDIGVTWYFDSYPNYNDFFIPDKLICGIGKFIVRSEVFYLVHMRGPMRPTYMDLESTEDNETLGIKAGVILRMNFITYPHTGLSSIYKSKIDNDTVIHKEMTIEYLDKYIYCSVQIG